MQGPGLQSKSLQHTASCCPCRPLTRPFTATGFHIRHSKSAKQLTKRRKQVDCHLKEDSTSTQPQDQQSQPPIYHIAAELPRPGAQAVRSSSSAAVPYIAAAVGVALTFFALKKIFDTPSRAYKENVGDEYDSWTDDGVLEYYWGEHIHLGYYSGASVIYLAY